VGARITRRERRLQHTESTGATAMDTPDRAGEPAEHRPGREAVRNGGDNSRSRKGDTMSVWD